jgi:hypothetical protein
VFFEAGERAVDSGGVGVGPVGSMYGSTERIERD